MARGDEPMAVTETDKLNKTNAIDVGNAKAIIFDKRWDFSTGNFQGNFQSQNIQGYVELRVLESLQAQQAEFNWIVSIADFVPLQYNVDISSDGYREFALPSGSKLLVDVANFRTSRRQCTFDLLIELKLPIGMIAPLRVFNDTVHCAIPTTNMVEEQLRQQPNIAQLERALASMRAITSTSN
jgi:hypothetical protein